MIFENESPSPLISAKPMPSKRLFTLPRIDQSIIRSTNLGKKLGISVGRGLTLELRGAGPRASGTELKRHPGVLCSDVVRQSTLIAKPVTITRPNTMQVKRMV